MKEKLRNEIYIINNINKKIKIEKNPQFVFVIIIIKKNERVKRGKKLY
jgi:hypothetical protein